MQQVQSLCFLIICPHMRKTLTFHICATVLLVLTSAMSVWAKGVGPAANNPVPAQAPQVNNVAQTAMQQGVQACAGRINQVSSFLGFGPDAGALLMVPPNGQDQRLVSLAMELRTPAGPAYASASFAPNQVNGCGASYDAVVFWRNACDAVAASQFGTLKKVGLLKQAIAVLDGGPATKVFLMPAGRGCVSIKKEVVIQ